MFTFTILFVSYRYYEHRKSDWHREVPESSVVPESLATAAAAVQTLQLPAAKPVEPSVSQPPPPSSFRQQPPPMKVGHSHVTALRSRDNVKVTSLINSKVCCINCRTLWYYINHSTVYRFLFLH